MYDFCQTNGWDAKSLVSPVHTTRLGAALNYPHIKRKTHTDDQTKEEIIIGGVREGGGGVPLPAMHAKKTE
jgi:hypothetical protein